MKYAILTIVLVVFACQSPKDKTLDRSGFELIHKEIPNIVYEIRYATNDNFVGALIDGYSGQFTYLSKAALRPLKEVQKTLNKEGLGLKLFDAYRPQKAVDHFVRWGKVLDDTLTKWKYYPQINKKEVFDLGYVAKKSGHSRGSTVDLTIINLATQEELDMGSPWDFFGEISHHNSPLVNTEQRANREKLKSIMQQNGFKPYANEWWHYTLINEPFTDIYFNFDIRK